MQKAMCVDCSVIAGVYIGIGDCFAMWSVYDSMCCVYAYVRIVCVAICMYCLTLACSSSFI